MTITDFLLARIAEDEGAHEADHFGDSPCRAERECEAKRHIVGLHIPDDYIPDDPTCQQCARLDEYPWAESDYEEYPCPTLRALAAVYADHPDYDPKWAL